MASSSRASCRQSLHVFLEIGLRAPHISRPDVLVRGRSRSTATRHLLLHGSWSRSRRHVAVHGVRAGSAIGVRDSQARIEREAMGAVEVPTIRARMTVSLETWSRVRWRHNASKASIGRRGRVVAWSRRGTTTSTGLLYGGVRRSRLRTSSVRSSGVANLKTAVGRGVIDIVMEDKFSNLARNGGFEARQELNRMSRVVVAGR